MNAAGVLAQFLMILWWESLQNLPPLLGLTTCVKLYNRNRVVALAAATGGCFLGSLLIAWTEPLIYREATVLALGPSFWVNAVVFSVLAMVGSLYMSHVRDRPARLDAGVGFVLAFVLAGTQALFDGSTLPAFGVHGLALALSFTVILLGIRWALSGPRRRTVLLRTLLLNVVGSIIIVIVDYSHLLV